MRLPIEHSTDKCLPFRASKDKHWSTLVLRIADGDLTIHERDLNAIAGSTVNTLVPCSIRQVHSSHLYFLVFYMCLVKVLGSSFRHSPFFFSQGFEPDFSHGVPLLVAVRNRVTLSVTWVYASVTPWADAATEIVSPRGTP